uniref:Uncharacterized protein n=1 Tax=Siphoviridae sp. ctHip2 TaxID=2827830 RepID=A0A8S5RW67_9CAUD|nr:MAG TPA: hypothetical protein [Siphoviridae sp. ctHip2]
MWSRTKNNLELWNIHYSIFLVPHSTRISNKIPVRISL